MKVYSDKEPQVLEMVGNGSLLYHWDMRKDVSDTDTEGVVSQWVYNEVVVWEKSREKITGAVLNELWNKDYEQKLINEYNSAVLGVYEEDVARQKIDTYMAFLIERKRVKDLIDADCEKLGVL